MSFRLLLGELMSRIDPQIIDWYEKKTPQILQRYGGHGPRVHYHTGVLPSDVDLNAALEAPLEVLSQQLFAAQERLLEQAFARWGADAAIGGEVIDVGCGLGGTSIYLAQRFGARVTVLTLVLAHAKLVQRFASEAAVGPLVSPEVGDAHTVAGLARFDQAVCLGAANYFDRTVWFAQLRQLLRARGDVFIEDIFAGRPDSIAAFNRYWRSNLGPESDYIQAAHAAGFALVSRVDNTREAGRFWRLTLAHSMRQLALGGLEPAERADRERAIAYHEEMFARYQDGGFSNLLLHFRRMD